MKIDAVHTHADPCNEFQAGSRINDVPVPNVGYYCSRLPVKPVIVGELAGLDPGGQQKELLA